MTDEKKSHEHDEQVEDLDVHGEEAEVVKGGRKAGKDQQEYLKITLEDVQITGY